jgi:hypothetical protein
MTTLPAPLFGRSPRPVARVLVWAGAAVAVAAFSALDYWAAFHPPCLDFLPAVLLALAGGFAALVASVAWLRGKPTQFLESVMRWSCGGLVFGLVLYLALFFSFTLPLPDHYHREVIGWGLTDEARSELRGPPPMSVPDLVREWDSEVDRVYTGTSLDAMRTVFVALWVVLFLNLGLFVATVASAYDLNARMIARDVADSFRRLPPGTPTELVGALRKAIEDVRAEGGPGENIRGSILAVEGTLEGETSLLQRIAAGAGEKLKETTVEKQIEELRKKGILPGHIASEFHTIRVFGNKARHKDEAVTAKQADLVIRHGLSVVEWFCCEYQHGPRLKRPAPR